MTEFNGSNRFGDANQDPASAPDGETGGQGPAALERLIEDLRRLVDQAAIYLAARQDQLKLAVRRAAIAAVLGLLGLIVAGATLVTAAVLMLTGIAAGLGELFGQRPWLGELATGLAVLALVALGARLTVSSLIRTSRWRTINRYAKRHKQQHERERAVGQKPGDAPQHGAPQHGAAVGK